MEPNTKLQKRLEAADGLMSKILAEIEPERIYNTVSASRILRCSRQNVALQCMHERLASTKLDDGRYLIKGSDLIAFLHSRAPRNTSKRQAMAELVSAGAS